MTETDPRPSVETIASFFRNKHPKASAGAVARHVLTALVAHGTGPNTAWMLAEMLADRNRADHDRSMILADFRDAEPGAAAVAEMDSFYRANPHLLNEAP